MKLSNERLEAHLPRIAGPCVLHVGCVAQGGEKFLLHWALRKSLSGSEIWGIDIDADGIGKLKRRGFRVLVADAESMELDRQFDTIFAGELIEHLANPGRFLECSRRMFKPKGKLVLSTPNPFSVEHVAMYVRNLRRAFNRGHTVWMCPRTLEQISRPSGLRLAELAFVDNLCPEFVTSRWSKCFALLWKTVRPILAVLDHLRFSCLASRRCLAGNKWLGLENRTKVVVGGNTWTSLGSMLDVAPRPARALDGRMLTKRLMRASEISPA